MALKLMRESSQVELSSSTQTQIFSPHYEGIWSDGDRQLSYFRRKDGQRLFVATKESQNAWVLEQAENLVLADVAYHRAIAQQRHHRPQRQVSRDVEQEQ